MKKKVFRFISLALVICLVLTTAVACGGGSKEDTDKASGERETITLKIGGGHMANGMAYTSVAQQFFQTEITKRAAEKTNYDVEWIEAYGGTVAKLPEGLTACQNGLLDVLVNSYAFDNQKLS